MGKRLPLVMGLPDPIGVAWLDEVQRIASPAFIGIHRVSVSELRLVALPNPRRDKRVMKSLERKRQKQLEREQEQQNKVTPE